MGITYNTSIVRDGLVLHLDAANKKSYPESGSTWKDLSGNGNDGTLINGVGYSSGNNGSLTFDGSNQYVENTTDNITNIANDYTINTWIYPQLLPQLGGIVSLGTDYDTNVIEIGIGNIHMNSSSEGLFIREYGSSSSRRHVVNHNLTAGWQLLTFVSNDQNFRMFKNGYLINLHDVAKPSADNISGPFYVGATRFGTTPQRNFNGKIGVSQIYNRALSEAEIKQNFEALRGRFGI